MAHIMHLVKCKNVESISSVMQLLCDSISYTPQLRHYSNYLDIAECIIAIDAMGVEDKIAVFI